jgi:hypothetical protein
MMNRSMAVLCIACTLILFACVVPISAESQSVQRTVVPAENGDGLYRVSITFPPGQVWGITETISDGMTFEGTDIPADSFVVRGEHIDFALVNTSVLTYQVSIPPGHSGKISGEWTDMITGEMGSLPSAEISSEGKIVISDTFASGQGYDNADPTPAVPLSPVTGLMAVGFAGVSLLIWRRKQ